MKAYTLIIGIIWLITGVTGALAETCPDHSTSSHFVNRLSTPAPGAGTMGTSLASIDIAWPYAYVGGYPLQFGTPYFYVVDISDQANPTIAGSLTTVQASVADIEVHGTNVYTVNGNLRIIDVSDPAAPVMTGSVPLPYWSASVSVVPAEALAFVASRDSGLVAVDLSNASAPLVVSNLTFGTFDSVESVTVDFPYAYLMVESFTGFVVVDVSDPANMQVVGSLPILIRAVDFSGGYVYAASSDGLRVIDVADPLLPVEVGFIGGLDLSSVAVFGSVAYTRTGPRPVLYDISDPANPVTQTGLNIILASPSTRPMAEHNGYVYGAAGGQSNINSFGLEVCLLGDDGPPLAPPVANIPTQVNYDMRFHGDMGYFIGLNLIGGVSERSLSLYDIADPTAPVMLGAIIDNALSNSFASVEGDAIHAFVISAYEIRAYDITVPAAISLAGTFPISMLCKESWLDGTHLYLVDGEYPDRGLRVYDVSNPAVMAEVGYVEILSDEEGINDVFIRGDYAYVTAATLENYGTSSFNVVDITDPTVPVVVATVELPSPARKIAVAGNTAWVSYGHSVSKQALRLAAIDITDPLLPLKINDIGSTYSTSDITAVGDHLYLVAKFQGPAVFDISNPLQAFGVGVLSRDLGLVGRIGVGNSHVFVARSTGGVDVYAPQCNQVSLARDKLPVISGVSLQAHPNPFNPRVTLSFSLAETQHVSLDVYDVAGRKVAAVISGEMLAGTHQILWQGRDDTGQAAPSGVYFARIVTGAGTDIRKLSLLK